MFLGLALIRHNKCFSNASNALDSDLGVRVIAKIGKVSHGTFILLIWKRSDIIKQAKKKKKMVLNRNKKV